MSSHYKAFIVVIILTVLGFLIARPVFVRFMSPEDFARRRNAWLALTVAAFLIPSFWMYVLVAVVVVAIAAQRDSNPAALYMFLLLVVPPSDATLPGFGIVNQLFPVNHFRVLSLALLLPALYRLAKNRDDTAGPSRWHAADILLLAYAVLTLTLLAPYRSVTGTARAIFLTCLDMLLPYFVLSRTIKTRAMFVDVLAAFVLALMVLAPIAAAETVRGWLLYGGVDQNWGVDAQFGVLRRGDLLRAQVTSGQPIVMGYAFAAAVGMWLFLVRQSLPAWARALGWVALVGGLVAPWSRGPWVGGLAIVLAYLLMGPNPWGRTLKGLMVLAAIGGAGLLSPWSDRIIDLVPFVGTVDEGNVGYRQQLAEMSWMLIQQNPVFGSPFFTQYMEELRTGAGIIDVVNTYAIVALNYGLVGAVLFVGVFVFSMLRALRNIRRVEPIDYEFSLLGASIVATLVGLLVIIGTVSNIHSVPFLYLALAGLATAFSRHVESHATHQLDLAQAQGWNPRVRSA